MAYEVNQERCFNFRANFRACRSADFFSLNVRLWKIRTIDCNSSYYGNSWCCCYCTVVPLVLCACVVIASLLFEVINECMNK